MPRKQRIAKQRMQITHGQISHLRFGYDFFNDGFGGRDGEPLDDDAMRQAWRENREAVIAYHLADCLHCDDAIYAELRFDEGMSHKKALDYRQKARSRKTAGGGSAKIQ